DINQTGGDMLLVSQFTLAGDVRKGRRPSFEGAERPEKALPLFNSLVERVRNEGVPVQTGEFQAHMDVELVNDGPVTILLDSRKVF
ncbi:MAG: D-aminoacyl-tRNA deacylase, partial [Proteobacteria bacterium]|nr:D-aminoacyl-tRNA deacylase [Pseudomonadota bacterium]